MTTTAMAMMAMPTPMIMMTAMPAIKMMPPPKAASMMAVVVQALLLVVDAESGERPQIPVSSMPEEMVYRDGR